MHHRSKLFPDGIADLNNTSNTTLYEERSLMSLDKSARRRDLRDSQALVAESPTMKRLLSMPSLAREAREKGNGEDVFKMPLPPIRRNGSTESSMTEESGEVRKQAQQSDSAARTRLPRKQERPRPLPRGDSATSNMRDMLKRREVSLARKTSTAGVKKKTKDSGEGNEIGRKRKRKSASPQSKPTSLSRTLHVVLIRSPSLDDQNSPLRPILPKLSLSFPTLPPKPSLKLHRSRNPSLEPSLSHLSQLSVQLSDLELPIILYLFPSAFLHLQYFQAIDEMIWTGIRWEDRKEAMKKNGSSRGKRIFEAKEVMIAKRVGVRRTKTMDNLKGTR